MIVDARRSQTKFLFEIMQERKLSDFNLRLTLAFVQSGIPLHKINSVPLRKFLEEETKKSIPGSNAQDIFPVRIAFPGFCSKKPKCEEGGDSHRRIRYGEVAKQNI
uniref:Uncharacterized protein n=1 Tax=Romanomermis culicivorax TaxID=13658 RepID=A0A915KVR1_ROMCU